MAKARKPVVNNIYYIEANPIHPVGNAGSVVIAINKERAVELVNGLYKPGEPKLIGISRLEEQVVFYNTGDY